MKCPLNLTEVLPHQFATDPDVGDCLKEECAWWDTAFDMCSCRSIARQLDGILADMHRMAGAVESLADRPG